MAREVLQIDQVEHRYGSTLTLQGINLTLEEGRIACLLGASGCGKTTLLRCIAGFEKITAGSIRIKQTLVSSPDVCLAPGARRIGVVFQDYALFPHMTVADNLGFGIRHLSSTARREKVRSLLHAVALEDFADRYPLELSGGQQQRVALARALAPEPELLLLDEPFSNLDSSLRDRMKHELKLLLRSFAVTALIVTHNQDEAFDMADEIAVMSAGKIVQVGSGHELYHQPRSRAVAAFLGMSSFLPAELTRDGRLVSELGVRTETRALEAGKVSLLLRPDAVVPDDQSVQRARVERIAFRGLYRIYSLKLASGLEIQCFTSAQNEEIPIGSKIGIRVDLAQAVVLYE